MKVLLRFVFFKAVLHLLALISWCSPGICDVSVPPSYLLLDSFGTVRLVETGRTGTPRIYDLAAFGDGRTQFVDMEATTSDVYLLNSEGEVRTLGDPDWRLSAPLSGGMAIDLELNSSGDGFYILDRFGGVHSLGTATRDWGEVPPYFGWDIARDLEVTTEEKGYYLLDGYGIVHSLGTASIYRGVYFGWDIARDLELLPDESGCCAMDGLGNVYLLGKGTPRKLADSSHAAGDVARDLVLFPDNSSFFTLDGFGNISNFGNAPFLQGFPLRQNIAQSIVPLTSEQARQLLLPPASTKVFLSPTSTTIADWQDSVEIDLNVENAFALKEVQCEISFEPSALAVSESPVRQRGESSFQERCFVENSEPGLLSVRCLPPAEGENEAMTGSGTFLTVKFIPLRPGISQVGLHNFRGSDARTFGSSWKLPDPEPVTVNVVTKATYASLSISRAPLDASQNLLTADIFLLDATSVHGARFDLNFDNRSLELVQIEEGHLLRSFGPTLALFEPRAQANAAGELSDNGICLLGNGSTAKGTGTIATLTFSARGSLNPNVELNRVVVTDGDGNESLLPVKKCLAP